MKHGQSRVVTCLKQCDRTSSDGGGINGHVTYRIDYRGDWVANSMGSIDATHTMVYLAKNGIELEVENNSLLLRTSNTASVESVQSRVVKGS